MFSQKIYIKIISSEKLFSLDVSFISHWCAFILHLTMQALNMGYAQDALVDMTGAVGEIIEFKDNLDVLWDRMLPCDNVESGPLLTAGIMSAGGESILPSGLVTNHAYAITAVKELQGRGMTVGWAMHIAHWVK